MPSLRRFDYDELPAAVADRLAARVKRLGYLGEFFRCTAHQPETLAAFIDFTEAGKAALSANLTETIALSSAGWMGNAYERNQHERLCLKLGLSRDWVRQVNALAPDAATLLDDQERLVQRLVLAMLETKGVDAPGLVEQAIAMLGAAATVAVLMVVGRYVVHGLIVNSLALAPPVASIFADEDPA